MRYFFVGEIRFFEKRLVFFFNSISLQFFNIHGYCSFSAVIFGKMAFKCIPSDAVMCSSSCVLLLLKSDFFSVFLLENINLILKVLYN